jgi:hypothetical protein
MSGRARQLFHTADDQISDLIALLDGADDAALHAPCAGREKLGDGSVAAVAMHAADNYHRIADYLDTDAKPGHRTPDRRHRIPMFGGAHSRRGDHGHSGGAEDYRSDKIDPRALLERLETARVRLSPLEEFSDARLATVPPASEMRFADGQRTLEEIMVGLLNHQRHQCNALTAALATPGRAQ